MHKIILIISLLFCFGCNMIAQVHKDLAYENDIRYINAESIMDSLELEYQRYPYNWEYHPDIPKDWDEKTTQKLKEAYNFYDEVGSDFDFDNKNIITELRKAHIHFLLKEYKKALNIYEDANKNEKQMLAEYARENNQESRYSPFHSGTANWLLRLYVLNNEPKNALIAAKERYPDSVEYNYYTCNNAQVEDRIYQARIMGEIYLLKNDLDTALSYLLPEVFLGGTSANFNLVDFTSKELLQSKNRDYLQKELEKSITNIYYRQEDDGIHFANDDINYFISFLNVEIEVPVWKVSDDLYPNEKNVPIAKMKKLLKEHLRKSQFYMNITSN